MGSGYTVRRAFYDASLADFKRATTEEIVGALTRQSIAVERPQTDAWIEQIKLLKEALKDCGSETHIYFEYVVPRLGKRIDCIVLLERVLCVVEFKVGESAFLSTDLDQVWDYALDLNNFHETSHQLPIIPMLVATNAAPCHLSLDRTRHEDRVLRPVKVGQAQLHAAMSAAAKMFDRDPIIGVNEWESGRYCPTPTIVEAARALYAGHRVEDISRSGAGEINLARTSKAIDRIIARSKSEGMKSICFVTGVPGAGKTLVGLDVANRHMDKESSTHSVFLSGNGPLVSVLREALSRDLVARKKIEGLTLRKGDAQKQVSAFIQNVHHFRDECLADRGRAPIEHVVLFDEAQRAWNLEQTQAFMTRKRGLTGFSQSEPEFLVSCMDRHQDWATVVCLVGNGQEINTGEAGISEWLEALQRSFSHWHVHASAQLHESESHAVNLRAKLDALPNVHLNDDLHLAVSMRSFRAASLSRFVKLLLELDEAGARQTLFDLQARYPIVLTRKVGAARKWLRSQARGTERYGLVVSSQAQRLKPHALDVRVKTDPVHWFLGDKNDTRSSYYLEDVGTEFQVQGLELDWAGVVWDGDLRFSKSGWEPNEFSGTKWRRIRKPERQQYLVNAYRVLLTRARQGMVIVVPDADTQDPTRGPEVYNSTYSYLKELGLTELSD